MERFFCLKSSYCSGLSFNFFQQMVFVAKAMRQLLSLKTPRPVAQRLSDQHLVDPKPPGGCHEIGKELIKDGSLKSSHPYDNG